jgi:regulator of protease activity HflC (stomatin/prohibitin superfamily)
MPKILWIALATGAAAMVVYLVGRLFDRVTVWDYEQGLRYRKGRFIRKEGPGQYWIYKAVNRIIRVDMRTQYHVIVGQEVLSSDGITLKVSVVAAYRVADPIRSINEVSDYSAAMHLLVQGALREVIGAQPIDELLENRKPFDAAIYGKCSSQLEELGLTLVSINIRDIMFPGELKNVFAQVVKARKEGLAALEKARGENAALRNLANAARLLENNPTLLQLRILQAVGESSGNTVVLRMPNVEGQAVVAGTVGEQD